MFQKVGFNPDLVAGEHKVLQFWAETRAFDILRLRQQGKTRWSFLDGPITANNPMGVHHAWGRTLKDAYHRFFAMTGHQARYQNGFDCQGLWVEVEVERELGFRSKRDIEAYGLERFINKCKERVWHFSRVQTEQSIRLGYWMDWANSYYTMSDENNYAIWAFLKKCHLRGFIYKGLDAMPWCPRCGTGISEQERKEGYRTVADDALFVRFPIRGRPGEYLLVWTTTPWTLAANVAAAVHPDLPYVRARQNVEIYYLLEARLPVLEGRGPVEVLASLPGRQLVGLAYEGPFDHLQAAAPARAAHRVIPWSDVSEREGTGIVQIAPGCGKEDFELSKQFQLPVLSPLDEEGRYVDGYGSLSGKYAGEVTAEVIETLRQKGFFYKAEKYLHEYPHCWRCGTPLLFRVVDEWFVRMDWRDEIKRVAQQIQWIPEFGLQMELDWLTNMGDWMISKKRYWGLALPIFECPACGTFDVIGSREELKQRCVAGWEEFEGDPEHPHSPHRPWIDAVRIACPRCGEPTPRIPDVGNPWLDAGIVAYSTVKYFTDREYWKQWIPADLILECFPGQFRNWFYALLAMSTMMEGIPPCKRILGHALVRDEKGEEMHKSKGNAIWFDEAAERMGADVMRWIYCRQNPVQNLNFGYGVGREVENGVFRAWWHTYRFFCDYAELDGFDPRKPPIPVEHRPYLDRWILSELQGLIEQAHRCWRAYDHHPFVRQAENFIEEQLSNWYVRRSRRRFWSKVGEKDAEKWAAYQTLYEVLLTLAKLLAPVVPFVAERMYQNLVHGRDLLQWGEVGGPSAKDVRIDPTADPPESVHHCSYPVPDPRLIDPELNADMKLIQEIATAAHALREQAGHRVRQPLAELRVGGAPSHRRALERLGDLLLEELNVKRLTLLAEADELKPKAARWRQGALERGPASARSEGRAALGELTPSQLEALQRGEKVSLELGGETIELGPADVDLIVPGYEGWVTGALRSAPVRLALDVKITPALRREGLARDLVRHVQQLRKEAGLKVEEHIRLAWQTDDPELAATLQEWAPYICQETLCQGLSQGQLGGGVSKLVQVGGKKVRLELQRLSGAPRQEPASPSVSSS
jgi:isoleucyl-tRNA synthetase